ncbi:hypothetical protein [Nostoc sp. 'Peltigera membranacea cyanobiont' 232]|uniref:hypothetical protein n=1 Tax=Nostoc sp. 'Peltigera membranacea cyanobiont' 232 TaxID=2014531 RepID=UPI00117E2BA8|nr:hypothetical protein [Nostoc sp. 'Peltigera membranacea cyanobiont' 232]
MNTRMAIARPNFVNFITALAAIPLPRDLTDERDVLKAGRKSCIGHGFGRFYAQLTKNYKIRIFD